MDGVVAGQAAAKSFAAELGTVDGPDQTPADATAPKFGPLWSYAKAAKYSSYLAIGTPEPAAGYSTFTKNDWDSLYNPGKPKNKSYPATTAYASNSGANLEKPPIRVNEANACLTSPCLLACPVNGNRARVLAIEKFFMTVPAKRHGAIRRIQQARNLTIPWLANEDIPVKTPPLALISRRDREAIVAKVAIVLPI
jgi:hypothetical protein